MLWRNMQHTILDGQKTNEVLRKFAIQQQKLTKINKRRSQFFKHVMGRWKFEKVRKFTEQEIQ